MTAKPNIIVFMTDHKRGDTIQAGSPVKTPNLDRFRKQAVNFTRLIVPLPTAAPAVLPFQRPLSHGARRVEQRQCEQYPFPGAV